MAERAVERLGLIGLGIMGKPMARNLLKAGYTLTVHNRSRGPVDELAAEGARPAGGPREVAEQSDVIILMLPDSPHVQEVVAGENGVFAGARPGSLIVDMSTISPVVAGELAAQARERGLGMLDAPDSGGVEGAIKVMLSIMVCWSAYDFAWCQPDFEVFCM